MKKIVFVHLFNDRSGSPKVLSQVVKAASALSHDIEILTSNHQNGFLDDLPGVRRKIFYERNESKIITLFLYIYSQCFLFLYCLRYVRCEVLFYVNTMMPFGALLAAKLMGKPVICHIHETSVKPNILKIFLRLIIQFCANKVVFVSKYLREVEGFRKLPQYVVYNALDKMVYEPVMKTSFDVLMVCSLKAYKGVVEFCHLAQALGHRNDIKFALVLNASDEEITSSKLLVSVPRNVMIYPRQSDVSSFYTSSSLLLNLSRTEDWIETFGLTILEAMAHGLPAIVPPVGGPAEIVSHGHDGFLISCHDLEKLSQAIILMADNPDFYARLSESARLRANQFDLDQFNKSITQIIEGM